MLSFLVCACKSQDIAQSQKIFGRSNDRTTARFRNSASSLCRKFHVHAEMQLAHGQSSPNILAMLIWNISGSNGSEKSCIISLQNHIYLVRKGWPA